MLLFMQWLGSLWLGSLWLDFLVAGSPVADFPTEAGVHAMAGSLWLSSLWPSSLQKLVSMQWLGSLQRQWLGSMWLSSLQRLLLSMQAVHRQDILSM